MKNVGTEMCAVMIAVENANVATLGDLRNFVDELDMRISRIQGNDDLVHQLRSAWAALEEVYAVTKDRGDLIVDAFGEKVVAASLKTLKDILSLHRVVK